MGKYHFSKNSFRRMDGVSRFLCHAALRSIEASEFVDFGVGPYGGLRSAETQHHLFKKGRSKADGYDKKSYHQSGNALDLVPWIDGKFDWSNTAAFREIKRLMFKAWEDLQFEGKIPKDNFLHWGGHWQSFQDYPHFEIRPHKQKR